MRIGLLRLTLFAFAVAALAACSSSTTATPGVAPVNTTTNIAVADGEPVPPAGGTIWDLTQMTTSRTGGATYTTLAVTLTFMQANPLASLLAPGTGFASGNGASLILAIGLDSDNNTATGSNAVCNGINYPGMDFLVDGTSRLADGNFPIRNATSLTQVGEATVTGSGSSITITIQLSVLSSASGGGLIAEVGNVFGGSTSGTDCAPDSSTPVAY
jgi:hypothetical protein